MGRHECFDFPDSEAFLSKVAALGVDIPFTEDLSPLFESIEVAGRRLANRFAVQPMEGCDGDGSGAPGDLTFRRYRRYAQGGSGLIWFESVAVVAEGRSNPRQLLLTEGTAGAFGRLVTETRRAARERWGSRRDPLLVVQLTHPGRMCRPEGRPRPVIARRDPYRDPAEGVPADLEPISDGALDRLQDAFVRAAELAAAVGFDGVDIKACNGYLVSELLAAHTRENSRYGGSFENRTRFLLDVVRRIAAEVPRLFPASRINAFDGLPYPYGFGAATGGESGAAPGGVPPIFAPDLSEAGRLASELARLGCPVLNVSLGIPSLNPHFGRPFNQPHVGAPMPKEHPLEGVARLIAAAAAVQAAAPALPVVGTGYSWLRRFFPFVGAAVLSSGRAGFVGIGRMAFAYPDCVADLEEKGALDQRKVCVGCSRCSQIMRDGGRAGCAVRDREIYGPIYRAGRRGKE